MWFIGGLLGIEAKMYIYVDREFMHSRNQHVSHHLIINVFVCYRWVLFRYICMDGYVPKP